MKLIDHSFKERLKSVSLVVTSLLTSLHDTTIEGMNKGFRKATHDFEKIIGTSEKITVNTDKILKTILEGQHNVIVIIGAATMAVLTLMVLAQIAWMMKIVRRFEERSIKTIEAIEEMQERWANLETAINNQVQEVGQAGARFQELTVGPSTIQRAPIMDSNGTQRTSQKAFPARGTGMLAVTVA